MINTYIFLLMCLFIKCYILFFDHERRTGMEKLLAKVRVDHPDPQGSAGLWLIKGPHAPNVRVNAKYGTPVMNGDLVRLVCVR